MLAVGLSLEEARKVIHGHESRVSIGAVNGPEMLTLSGDLEPLKQIAQLLEGGGVFNRPVRVQVAYHSHHMDSIRAGMMEGLKGIEPRAATTPLYSTVTGSAGRTAFDSRILAPKRAPAGVVHRWRSTSMLKDGFDTFIEIGPHPVLVGGAGKLFEKLKADAVIAAAITRKPESVVFLLSLARLAAHSVELNADALFGSDGRYVRLPNYPWQHTRCWYESPSQAEAQPVRHPYLKRSLQVATQDGLGLWEASMSINKFPYLRDHQVDGECVLPATARLESAKGGGGGRTVWPRRAFPRESPFRFPIDLGRQHQQKSAEIGWSRFQRRRISHLQPAADTAP